MNGVEPAVAASDGLAQQLALRDIRAPADPSLWPPAPGWWLLAAMLAVLAVIAGRHLWRVWRRRRLSRRVLAELDRWHGESDAPVLAAGISALLKRAALHRFGRRSVAPLTGDAWLDFLDHTGGDGQFQHGPGRLLADVPYAPPSRLDAQQAAALIELARGWLRRNL